MRAAFRLMEQKDQEEVERAREHGRKKLKEAEEAAEKAGIKLHTMFKVAACSSHRATTLEAWVADAYAHSLYTAGMSAALSAGAKTTLRLVTSRDQGAEPATGSKAESDEKAAVRAKVTLARGAP